MIPIREVFLVSNDNRSAAEDALRKDDLVGRQSIYVRSAPHIDIKEDGYFIVIDGSEEAVAQAKALLAGIAAVYEKKDEVIRKMEEQEERAIEGFGNLLG